MAIMGHSGGSKVHSMYTHVELPVKRQAIAALEAWVNLQHEELKKKEQEHASTEAARTETGPCQERGPKTVEEEIAS